MIKRLLFLITFTCGILIVFGIGTSSFLTYQAAVSQKDSLPECRWRCTKPNLLGIACSVNRGWRQYLEVPVSDRGGTPNCYRADWDTDDDGNMDRDS